MRQYASLFQALLSDLEIAPDILGAPITSDMGSSQFGRVALANSFYKKLCPTGNTRSADDAALKKFIAVNERLLSVPWDFTALNEGEAMWYSCFKDNLRMAVLPSPFDETQFDLDFIRDHMRPGPGSAQNADSRMLTTKLFESCMSYSSDYLRSIYRAALSTTGSWCDAEKHRDQEFGWKKVEGCKVFFAPKNAEISRLCGTEANMEMLIQQAIREFLELRLREFFGINLSTQADVNGELARIGSIDGSFGTIDLVSASDCVGLRLFQRDFPDCALKGAIMNSRSEYAIFPDGTKCKLNMVSTMGNGFTFPLQTIIFASAIMATYQVMGIPCSARNRDYGVFGDDIVVRRETYELLCRMLSKIGFEVNVGKSFNSGPFRESCGLDWYDGQNVRGIYVKSLETPQQVYSCINRLNRWSAYHGVALKSCLTLLMTWARDMRVPPSEADDAGLKVPFKLSVPKVTNSYWFKYRCFVRRIQKIRIQTTDDPHDDDALKHTNVHAEACGFLSGVYRRRDIVLKTDNDSVWNHDWSTSVSIRDRIGARSRYQVTSKSLPYWDFIFIPKNDENPDMDSDHRCYPLTRVSYGLWEQAVVANICN